MTQNGDHIREFEQARPLLIGLAYRLLGSRAEAEDVVQDTFLAWSGTDRDVIEHPRAWLTSVCTRRSLDVLKSARRSRTDYVGYWLPEPMATGESATPETDLMVSESVTMAFLLVLERLTPKERAAFVLHDVFAMEYVEIAGQLATSEAACRKLVSRARVNVRQAGNTKPAPRDLQQCLIDAFQTALRTGAADDLAGLLARDAVLTADSGGKAASILGPVKGAERILTFVSRALPKFWSGYSITVAEINAQLALIVRDGPAAHAVVSFRVNADPWVSEIMVMRNPDKLRGFDLPD
ncbi:RNA polymerase sigma factor SigJ [Nisaea denitrificans]|uniref:RNA polymerase sigma factor SigJ n=1 Tax=Nisaea denitrificans TaxID=390877 RepID=UPI0003FF7ACE|nr:RNA polymerase sigma factor SigJ [Nisaea denitrificans]